MNFIEMIKLIDKGCKITNPSSFSSNSAYIEYIAGYGVVVNGDVYDSYDFDFADFYDEDWEIYKEQPKLHTFEEALKAYKSGLDVRRKNRETKYHDSDCDFRKDDVMANDWIIMEGKL